MTTGDFVFCEWVLLKVPTCVCEGMSNEILGPKMKFSGDPFKNGVCVIKHPQNTELLWHNEKLNSLHASLHNRTLAVGVNDTQKLFLYLLDTW